MIRTSLNFVPMVALLAFAFGTSAFGQDLFSEQSKESKSEAAKETSRADGKESIFCPTMKTGQVCTHGTAAILGLKGADAEEWTVWARKYNKAVDVATLQLFQDAAVKLTPKQLELLKAWFAIGWNEQMNNLLYGRNLDNLETAKTEGLKTTK
ncbi:MAG: hypothetical protein EXQ56_10185 [Acidobacteria bacterium]|nr:hypothetical protein [Acidobacteriota bacterium]